MEKKTTPKMQVKPGPAFNRQQRRGIARNEKSLGELSSQVKINCNENLDGAELYEALLKSVSRRTGEIHIVVQRGEKSHFTCLPLASIYDGLQRAAVEFADNYNQSLDAQIADAAKTPEERQQEQEAQIAQQRNAQLEYLRDLRDKLHDPDYVKGMLAQVEEQIAKIENPDASEQCKENDNPVS